MMNWYRVTFTAPGIRPAVCELQAHCAADAAVCGLSELELMTTENVTPVLIECIDPPRGRRRVDKVSVPAAAILSNEKPAP